jgi:hypothetical protein
VQIPEGRHAFPGLVEDKTCAPRSSGSRTGEGARDPWSWCSNVFRLRAERRNKLPGSPGASRCSPRSGHDDNPSSHASTSPRSDWLHYGGGVSCAIRMFRNSGVTVLLIEQNATSHCVRRPVTSRRRVRSRWQWRGCWPMSMCVELVLARRRAPEIDRVGCVPTDGWAARLERANTHLRDDNKRS